MKINYPSNVLAKMQEIADGCMGQDAPYCQSACPMHTDIRGYVNLIGEGKEEEALGLIREKLFLPATLGRICAHVSPGEHSKAKYPSMKRIGRNGA